MPLIIRSSDEWDVTQDADKALDNFFSSCVEAGKDRCPFYESSPELIAQKLDTIFERLRTQPSPVLPRDDAAATYGVLDYSLLKTTIHTVLYSPYLAWQRLSAGLQALSEGNTTVISGILQYPGANKTDGQVCNDSQTEFTSNEVDVRIAIICSDARLGDHSYEYLSHRVVNASARSFFGGPATGFEVACAYVDCCWFCNLLICA
jgi:hypothetical protein